MTAAKDFIEQPSSGKGKTRPRPSPPTDAETPRMEAIHAEFLDNYHREAHELSEEEEEEEENDILQHDDSVPKSEADETTSRLTSEIPCSEAQELQSCHAGEEKSPAG